MNTYTHFCMYPKRNSLNDYYRKNLNVCMQENKFLGTIHSFHVWKYAMHILSNVWGYILMNKGTRHTEVI